MGPASVLHAINSALAALSMPFARLFDLPHLRAYFPLLAWSALGFTAIHVLLSPLLSRWVAPVSYAKLKGHRARNNWCVACRIARSQEFSFRPECALTPARMHAGTSMSCRW